MYVRINTRTLTARASSIMLCNNLPTLLAWHVDELHCAGGWFSDSEGIKINGYRIQGCRDNLKIFNNE